MATMLFNILAAVMFYLTSIADGSNKQSTLQGHLQQFGSAGPVVEVETINGFPVPSEFFQKYVLPSRAVLMKGAVKGSHAERNWASDDYFLSLSLPPNHTVIVENRKKQDQSDQPSNLHFQTFLRQYNHTDQYMVDSVPMFLAQELVLHSPIHCEEIYKDKLVDIHIWFSCGGTKSMLHTDNIENIICAYSGQKDFMMIDPKKYYEKVDMDLPVSESSSVDVDKVDLEKYPGLAEVEYTLASLHGGDCLYIPYKWFHQVRSYSRNIAVSIWWEYQKVKPADISKCTDDQYDPTRTLDKLNYVLNDNALNIPNTRDFFRTLTKIGPTSVAEYNKLLISNMAILQHDLEAFYKLSKQITVQVDKNNDGLMTREEVDNITLQEWQSIRDVVGSVEYLLADIEQRLADQADNEKNEGQPTEKQEL